MSASEIDHHTYRAFQICYLAYYFAAAEHKLYMKSVHIYLHKIRRLPESRPDVYEHLYRGMHVARRSGVSWAELSPDSVIGEVYAKHRLDALCALK